MTHDTAEPAVPAARKTWTTPIVRAMPTADTEAGPTPVNPEGAFGTGS